MFKSVKTLTGFLIIIVVLMAGFLILSEQKKDKSENLPIVNTPAPEQTACPLDAKLCSDGTAVGRTGPKCEFAPCPESVGIANKIIIISPKPDDVIDSPVTVTGKAVGAWFFEGSFPVEIRDDNEKLLGQGIASFVPSPEAPEWMTENLVDFSGTINFSKPTSETGYIVFKKDNPSGLPQNDESFQLPIKFSNNTISIDTSD